MFDIADKAGVTAGAIVGAMAEENMAYNTPTRLWGYADDLSDRYVKNDVNPQAFGDMVQSLAGTLGNTGAQAAAAAYFKSEIDNNAPRTDAYWRTEYQNALQTGLVKNPDTLDKAYHPMYYDIGHGNFRITTAIGLLNSTQLQAEVSALGLEGYKSDYALLVNDLIDETNAATAKFYALMIKEAQIWFESKHAWGDDWTNLPQAFKDAPYITYVNLGPDFLDDKRSEAINKGLDYEPMPGLDLAAGANHLANLMRIEAYRICLTVNRYSVLTWMKSPAWPLPTATTVWRHVMRCCD